MPSLDTEREWDVTVTVKPGDRLTGGMIYATCPETTIIEHRCLVRPDLSGVVESVAPNGKYKINDVIVTIVDDNNIKHELTLCQKWPIRHPRPIHDRLYANIPLITGQRVIDALFPIAKGSLPSGATRISSSTLAAVSAAMK